MKSIQVGVQASTIKEKFSALGAYETLRRVDALGYRSIELSQLPMTAETVEQLARAQRDFGVKIAALSASVAPSGLPGQETLATHFRKIVDDCHRLDCRFVRIGMLPLHCMDGIEPVLHFCKMANVAAQKLAEEGIELYYHNHHIEFRRFEGRTMLDIIAEQADRLGFELDVHWIQRGGMDPAATIRRYAGRAALIHLKDYRVGAIDGEAFAALGKREIGRFMEGFRSCVQFAEVGEGTLDMKGIIEAALASGAQYFFVEQDELYGRDGFDCLATSKENLNRLGYALS